MSTQSPQRYQLQQALGQGGQGKTYKALDRETKRMVAVKIFQLKDGAGWKSFDLFERECKVLQGLNHPGIPKFYDTFAEENKGTFGLVMELIVGVTLEQIRINKQLLAEAQLWNFLHQALDILEYLHSRHPPVIHRDLKPANFICRTNGCLSLVDFGGVRVALRQEGGSTVIGTFGYMAPEQLHGEATSATDIFGLAATMVALATGEEADKLPRNGLKIDLESIMEPSNLRNLLEYMLEPEPGDRLGTVAAVRQASQNMPTGTIGKRSRRPSSHQTYSPQGPPSGQAQPTVEDKYQREPLKGIPAPLALLIRALGTAGYIGLVLVDSIILPLVFVMLGAFWSQQPEKTAKLKQGKRTVRQAVGNGRRALKALAMGRDPYNPTKRPPRPLPPHSRRNRMLRKGGPQKKKGKKGH